VLVLEPSALRSHYRDLYARPDRPLDVALRSLLPPALRDPHLASLRSTGFLTTQALDRLLASLRGATSARAGIAAPIQLLDLGCGLGRVGVYVANAIGAQAWGIDICCLAPISDNAQSNRGSEQSHLVCGDLHRLPFRAGQFQVAIALEVIHLVTDVQQVLSEIRRVLANSATLVVSVYDRAGMHMPKRSSADWVGFFTRASFHVLDWVDVTAEWRSVMREKHAARLGAQEGLIEKYRLEALAEIEVSKQMLGGTDGLGFLDVTSRWEATLAAA